MLESIWTDILFLCSSIGIRYIGVVKTINDRRIIQWKIDQNGVLNGQYSTTSSIVSYTFYPFDQDNSASLSKSMPIVRHQPLKKISEISVFCFNFEPSQRRLLLIYKCINKLKQFFNYTTFNFQGSTSSKLLTKLIDYFTSTINVNYRSEPKL